MAAVVRRVAAFASGYTTLSFGVCCLLVTDASWLVQTRVKLNKVNRHYCTFSTDTRLLVRQQAFVKGPSPVAYIAVRSRCERSAI